MSDTEVDYTAIDASRLARVIMALLDWDKPKAEGVMAELYGDDAAFIRLNDLAVSTLADVLRRGMGEEATRNWCYDAIALAQAAEDGLC